MPNKSPSDPRRRSSEVLCPNIFGFSDLIVSEPIAGKGKGLPEGQTLLISGAPGAGKTTFALALARSLMKVDRKGYILYFISSEINLERLETMFAPMGWFDNKDSIFRIDKHVPEADSPSFYAIVPEPEVDRPVPSPEELVNTLFARIAKALSPSEATRERRRFLVIVDSVTSLLKGCTTQSDERRYSHEILYRLRALFGNDLALTILLAEQSMAEGTAPQSTTDDYLASFVFRLSLKALPQGRRLRTLEVVKSQGVDISVGEHSWVIVTDQTCHSLFLHKEFRSKIQDSAVAQVPTPGQNSTTALTPWGTVAIFPRPRLHLPSRNTKRSEDAELKSGIRNLEKLLTIKRGSTTLIAGPIAAGKTTMCLNFLLAPDVSSSGRKVFISFELGATDALSKACTKLGVKDGEIALFEFNQSQLDFNRLAAHVSWALEEVKPDRLVFDGLSEWLSVVERGDATRMLSTLMMMIRSQTHCNPTVFLSYELSLHDDPFAPRALGVNADNIIVVRPVNINDQIRKIVYVLKGDGSTPGEETVRELTREENELVVGEALDSFSGLLTGTPRPAEVLLQLFQENDAERKFNEDAVRRLRKLRNLRFKALEFSRSEISRTLEDTQSLTRFPPADLKILSVDEWCLAQRFDDAKAPLRDLSSDEFGTLPWKDFWIFEVEKSGPATNSRKEGGLNGQKYAIPGYMDYGIFCVNLKLLNDRRSKVKEFFKQCPQFTKLLNKDVGSPADSGLADVWKELLESVPRVWTTNKNGWFEKTGLSKLLTDLRDSVFDSSPQRIWGFAFDTATRETAVCGFFEIAWAFGASKSFLDAPSESDLGCAETALKFLQFLVAEGLMPERSTAEGSKNAFFARHFYSTLQSANSSGHDVVQSTLPNFLPLPFFPSGSLDPAHLKKDICGRLELLKQRLRFECSASPKGKRATESRQEDPPAIKNICDALDQLVSAYDTQPEEIQTATQNAERAFRRHMDQIPFGRRGDFRELWEWHILRARLFSGVGSLSQVVQSCSESGSNVPLETGSPFLTGYACTGSWMYGVHQASRSPRLAQELIEELTSLDAAERRAEFGAGLPARKDFFELHGSEPVEGISYLTWLQLLRCCGSRARRREQVIPAYVKPADVYRVVHEELLGCLDIAAAWRSEYSKDAVNEEAIKAMQSSAKAAISRISEVCRESVAAPMTSVTASTGIASSPKGGGADALNSLGWC